MPAITDSVTINGPGANQLSVSGNDASRVFDISGSASVTIAGLTITDGLATSGGGILLEGSAALSISNCTLTDNEALGIRRPPAIRPAVGSVAASRTTRQER